MISKKQGLVSFEKFQVEGNKGVSETDLVVCLLVVKKCGRVVKALLHRAKVKGLQPSCRT